MFWARSGDTSSAGCERQIFLKGKAFGVFLGMVWVRGGHFISRVWAAASPRGEAFWGVLGMVLGVVGYFISRVRAVYFS